MILSSHHVEETVLQDPCAAYWNNMRTGGHTMCVPSRQALKFCWAAAAAWRELARAWKHQCGVQWNGLDTKLCWTLASARSGKFWRTCGDSVIYDIVALKKFQLYIEILLQPLEISRYGFSGIGHLHWNEVLL